MSTTELRRARAPRHLCQRCRDRTPRFRYRGVVRADHDHSLCFECYRSELNYARARRLAQDVEDPVDDGSGGDGRVEPCGAFSCVRERGEERHSGAANQCRDVRIDRGPQGASFEPRVKRSSDGGPAEPSAHPRHRSTSCGSVHDSTIGPGEGFSEACRSSAARSSPHCRPAR